MKKKRSFEIPRTIVLFENSQERVSVYPRLSREVFAQIEFRTCGTRKTQAPRTNPRNFLWGERSPPRDVTRCLIHGPRLKAVFSRLVTAIRASPRSQAASRSIRFLSTVVRLSNWCNSSMDRNRKTRIDLESLGVALTHVSCHRYISHPYFNAFFFVGSFSFFFHLISGRPREKSCSNAVFCGSVCDKV